MSKRKLRCKVCRKIPTLKNGTSNIKSHFSSSHSNFDISTSFRDHYLNKAPPKRQKNMIDIQHTSAITKKYRKQSTEQNRHTRLCAEWLDMDFVPLEVVSNIDFNYLISNANPRLNKICNDTFAESWRSCQLKSMKFIWLSSQVLVLSAQLQTFGRPSIARGLPYWQFHIWMRIGSFKILL